MAKEKRLTPFESPTKGDIDYDKLVKEFGTQPISTVKNIRELDDIRGFKLGYVFSHRDFDKFMKAVKSKKKAALLTGFNASGSIHLGHKLTFDIVRGLQKKYSIPLYIPLSDDESYVTGKVRDQKEGMRNARLIAAQMIALGFDMKITKIFIHQQYRRIYNLAIKLSRGYTLSTIKAVYGFNDSINPGLLFYPVIQAADILLPEEPEFGGAKPVLVPVGIDQDPHIRVARDVAEKFGYVKPGALHVKYLPGLKGGKMSASVPGSAIMLNENPEKAARYCMNALTGGRDTVEEQRKLGGEADKCVVYEYLKVFFDSERQSKERYKKCYAGKLLCGECKQGLANAVKKFLKDYQAKVKKAERQVDKHLLE